MIRLSTTRAALAVAVALPLVSAAAHADTVETLVDSGPVTNRLNMVILGDGYTSSAADQSKLKSDATNVVTGLFGFRPYMDYRGLFNVKLVHTTSQSSAIPKSGSGSTQTALGCYYGCAGIDRLICCGVGGEGSVEQVAATNVPEVTVAVVVVNDTTYGGSGGSHAVVSTHPAAIDIARHELGHTLAGLADEYTAPYPGYPACDPGTDCAEPNVTLHATSPGKWGQWVAATQPIPTPDGTPGIGYFEGARYQTTGVYKPASNPVCIMNALGEPFCSVCAEAMSLAFWRHAMPVDTVTPPTTAMVTTTGCTDQPFELQLPPNAGQPTVTWKVDGAAETATTPSASITPRGRMPGTHTVEATVHDASPLIRSDPMALGNQTVTWSWQTDCTAPPIDAGAGAADGEGGGGGGGGGCATGDRAGLASFALIGLVAALARRRRRA